MACCTIPRVGPTNHLDHRVIVIGGGIGGLTAAITVLNRGIDVDVYEQAPRLGEVGAGDAPWGLEPPHSLGRFHAERKRKVLYSLRAVLALPQIVAFPEVG
jgi:flavin-dependent dehydrogenase